MSVVGVMDGQGTVKSPGLSALVEMNKMEKDEPSTSKSVKASEKPAKSSEHRPTKPSTDARYDELDKKWSDLFNRLGATVGQNFREEPIFQTIKVTPAHSPPTDLSKNAKPFIRPTTPLLKPADRLTTNPVSTKKQAASSSQSNRPKKSDRKKPVTSSDTDHPVLKKQSTSRW